MVLHSIIGEYDILYAQERELSFAENPKQEIMSTNPADSNKKRNDYDYS